MMVFHSDVYQSELAKCSADVVSLLTVSKNAWPQSDWSGTGHCLILNVSNSY